MGNEDRIVNFLLGPIEDAKQRPEEKRQCQYTFLMHGPLPE